MYASCLNDGSNTWQVKAKNLDHTCPISLNHKQVTAKWVAKKYQRKWELQQDWNISSFADQVRGDKKKKRYEHMDILQGKEVCP